MLSLAAMGAIRNLYNPMSAVTANSGKSTAFVKTAEVIPWQRCCQHRFIAEVAMEQLRWKCGNVVFIIVEPDITHKSLEPKGSKPQPQTPVARILIRKKGRKQGINLNGGSGANKNNITAKLPITNTIPPIKKRIGDKHGTRPMCAYKIKQDATHPVGSKLQSS